MTAHFGIVHGQAVSITLPAFLQWNSDSLGHKLPALLEALGARNVADAIDRITALMINIGLATRLGMLGLTSKDIDIIVEEGYYPERADYNPKAYARDEVHSVLMGIL